MHHKLLLAFCFVLVASYAWAVPISPPQTKEELISDIAQFLREDKEVASALKNADFDHFKIRSRRDAEMEDPMMDVENVGGQDNNKGFFDRAAKFVMEVLQRFLKWINTDN